MPSNSAQARGSAIQSSSSPEPFQQCAVIGLYSDTVPSCDNQV